MTALQHTFEFTTIAKPKNVFIAGYLTLRIMQEWQVKTAFFDGMPTIPAYTCSKSLLLAHHLSSSSKEGCRVFHHPACCSGAPYKTVAPTN